MTMPAAPSNPTPGQSYGTWGTSNNNLWNWVKGVVQTVWTVAHSAETPTGAQAKVDTAINGLSTQYEARIDRTGRAINDIVALQADGVLGLVTPGEGGGTIPDATTSTTGVIRLAGDLTGTATSPQIAAGVITNAEVSGSAAISLDKTADGSNRLAMTSAERTKLAGLSTGGTATPLAGLRYTFLWNGTNYVGPDGAVATSANSTAAARTSAGYGGTYRDYIAGSTGPDANALGLMIDGDALDGVA